MKEPIFAKPMFTDEPRENEMTEEKLRKSAELMREVFDNAFTNSPEIIKKYEPPHRLR